jgi:hypothetical protein
VYVPLRLVPSETLTPYADGLRHALVVDGVEQPQYHAATPGFVPSSLAGTLEDRLIARCASTMPYYKSFEPGSHRVQWVSRLIDGSELRSDELEVALRCPDATADAPKQDAGAAPKQDAGAPSVNPADASVPSAESDAAITRDAAAATDTEETNAAEVEDSGVSAAPIHDNISNVASADHAGCSVSSLRRGHSALSWALTLLVACFMQARLRSRCRDSK